MNCLILGNHTQGLGILRSLHKMGTYLHLVNDRLISLSRFSLCLNHYHRLNRDTLKEVYLTQNEKRLRCFIEHLVPKRSRWPVFCVNEDLVYFLYRNREALAERLAIPCNSIPDIIDKHRFLKEMDVLGLSIPKTHLFSEFDPSLLQKGSYLCKGRLGNRFRTISRVKGMIIRDRGDLESIRRAISSHLSEDDVLIQEKIQQNGHVLSSCGFSVAGELIRHFQYVKIRQHPDEFGTGTFLKSIYNAALIDITLRIIKHFRYTGIFEIEFVRDRGKYIIIEMNPRTWKSIHFATLCGQNMCAAYAEYCHSGRVPKPELGFAVEKTWVDLGTDIPMLLKGGAWRHPEYDRNTFFCVLSVSDPLPFLMEIALAPLIKLGV